MQSYSLDVVRYLAGFRMSATQGVLMATKLVKRCPKDAPEPVRHAVDKVRRAGTRVHTEWKRRATPKRRDARGPVAAMANTWNALHGRLLAWTKLPAEAGDEVAQATEMMDALFPDGLRFLLGDHGEQWLASDHKLEQLDETLEVAQLEALVDARFLAAVRAAHRAAGLALGTIGEQTPTTPVADLRPMLDELVQCIREYALQVLAHADLAKPAEIERVAHMLEPIDTHRARAPRDLVDDADAGRTPQPEAPVNVPAKPANDGAPVSAGERRVA